MPDPIGEMRGLLLAILTIEEYTGTYIRLSDLRLASVLVPRVLQQGLKSVLEQLERPITAKSVADWKLSLLGEALGDVDETAREQTKLLRESFGDEDTGIAAVALAAAVCLGAYTGATKIIDEIAYVLLYHDNVSQYHTPDYRGEVGMTLRRLASELRSTRSTIPLYRLLERTPWVLKTNNVLGASTGLVGWSNAVIGGDESSASEHKNSIAESLNILRR